MSLVTVQSKGSLSGIPGIPDSPEATVITHHSIELTWNAPAHDPAYGRLRYNVQEEENGRGSEFRTVYNGFSNRYVIIDLDTLTQFKYRVRATNSVGNGPWSDVLTVVTTRQPRSCENLHKALCRGDTQIVYTILQESSHYIDVPDNFGCSPLMSACGQNKNDIVTLLLGMGANVEYATSSGKTSLMEACYFGNTSGAKLLVVAGASWMTRDHSGLSALHYAVDGGHTDTVEYVLSEGVNVNDVSKTTMSGWTPLLRTATIGGNAQIAEVLINAGADVNRRDKDGKTPLMLATLNGFKDLVQLLLANGADPLSKSDHDKDARDFAESFHRGEILKLLTTKQGNK